MPFITTPCRTQARLFIERLFKHTVPYLCMNNFAMIVEAILKEFPEYLTFIAEDLIGDYSTYNGVWAFEAVCDHKTGNFTVQKVLTQLRESNVERHQELYHEYVEYIKQFQGYTCCRHVLSAIRRFEAAEAQQTAPIAG